MADRDIGGSNNRNRLHTRTELSLTPEQASGEATIKFTQPSICQVGSGESPDGDVFVR